MSYLLDKKVKRKKFLIIAICVALVLIILYFRSGIFRGLSSAVGVIFRPVLVVGNGIGSKFSNVSSFFASKSALLKDNENLKSQLDEKNATLVNYNSVLSDNESMKSILGRKNTKTDMVIAAILAKPNQSLYDTLIIDAGENEGVREGARVIALGSIPIGRIAEVGKNSSKVILFSNPGEKTEVMISKGVFLTAVGRGGGNFELILTKDLNLPDGTEVLLPGINNYVLGIVKTTISDPRDSLQKALLVSPVNIQELKFVEVEK